ncbi:hypothetical protein CGQ24_09275 [Arthrobacter sp. 7749]|nr:hypothetical protein CGQ24_09275 [Arthrobacter sp. 7749]
MVEANKAPTIRSGLYIGWKVAARAERIKLPAQGYGTSKAPGLAAATFSAIEIGPATTWLPPFTQGSIQVMLQKPGKVIPLKDPEPLMMLESGCDVWNDGKQTLGSTDPIVLPTPAVVAMLGLEPSKGHLFLEDSQGPGLALLTWRSRYIENDRGSGRPTISGAAIVIRPDLFVRLLEILGTTVTFRTFLTGNAGWLKS